MGPLQGQQGGAHDATERARRRDPPARCGRPDDECGRRHVDPLDDPELAIPAVELQDRVGVDQALRAERDPEGLDFDRLADRLRRARAVLRQARVLRGGLRPAREPAGEARPAGEPLRRAAPAQVPASGAPQLRLHGHDDGRREVGRLASVSRPGRNPLEGVPRQVRLHVLRLLRLDGLLHERQGPDQRRLHPGRREDEEPEGRPDGGRAPHRGRQPGPRVGRALPQEQARVLSAGEGRAARRVHVRQRAPAAALDIAEPFRTGSRTTTARSASTTSRTASAPQAPPAGSRGSD